MHTRGVAVSLVPAPSLPPLDLTELDLLADLDSGMIEWPTP
jgi:hypothetical protein